MDTLYFTGGLTVVLLATIVSGQNLPVQISPVNSSESGNCKSYSTTTKLTEIKEAIRSQVNPYLTSRYGPLRNCGGSGWIKVTDFNMSDINSTCPPGFTLRSTPVRSCGRSGNTERTTATFVTGEPYSHVCGRIIAIQKGSPDGFGPSYFDNDPLHYMDGITIRYGSAYNQGHVWSFIGGAGEKVPEIRAYCPCAYPQQWTARLPSFVGTNYFCETGNRGVLDHTTVFLDDPLWNGKGCAIGTCCSFNYPPWFYKELPQPTSNSLKVTLYLNGRSSEENIFITEMELYVSP